MAAQRRKFSDEEKLNILHQAGQKGTSNILRHYNISYSVFARWKKGFQKKGLDPTAVKSETMMLAEENGRLKKIIAEQALSIELKEEELRRISSILEKKSNNL
jgi:putative transposase